MTMREGAIAKLASEYTHGYGPSPFPSQIDAEVESVIQALAGPDGSGMLGRMRETHGFVFLAYAERMASLAVRENSVDILSTGMTALGVAGNLIYRKETLPVLALMFNSAEKIGVDLTKLRSHLSPNESDELQPYFDRFLSRSAADRAIQAMGYAESQDEGGFRYARTW